jgi:hypothetical protein
MKKQYKLSIEYDDELDEIEGITEVVNELRISDEEGILLETDDGKTIQLPAEIARYIEEDGILGIA